MPDLINRAAVISLNYTARDSSFVLISYTFGQTRKHKRKKEKLT